jgi:hypothetical protein
VDVPASVTIGEAVELAKDGVPRRVAAASSTGTWAGPDGPRSPSLRSDGPTSPGPLVGCLRLSRRGTENTGKSGQARECALFEAEDIRDWRGHDVVDPAGSKIGSLEAVYFDTATEQPTFATVKTPHGVSWSSSGLLILVVRPGLALVVEGAGLQAAVQDADEPVGQLPQRGVVACTAGADRVVVGARAG